MKTLTFLICILLPSIINAQQNDDIRLFPSSNHQTENSIAIDPTNNDNILVSTIGRLQDGKVHITNFFSADRGLTWNGSETTPNGVLTKGDPIAFFNHSGNAYISYKGSSFGIYCIKSTNKGVSWLPAVTVTNMDEADKEYLASDLSGIYPDNIYAAWLDFGSVNYEVRYCKSTNSGTTFSPSQIIYTNPLRYGHGPYITTASNGDVYIFFASLDKGSKIEKAIMFTKSTNGGNSFGAAQEAFTIAGIGPPDQQQQEFGDIRVNSFPSADINRSNGRIYVVYADKSTGNSDVYLRYSTNGGDTWIKKMVNSPSDNHQWFPSVAVDQSDGKVYVSYYNMDGSGFSTSHYVAVSSDNGNIFTRTKVSDVSFIPQDLGEGYAEGYMGDYYEIKASNGFIFPCWSHNNNPSGKFQAYISTIGGAEVELDQKLVNNLTVDKIDYWSSSEFRELEIPKTYHFKPNVNQVLRGEQEIFSSEKYNRWNVDNDVKNHRVFDFEPGQTILISQLEPTKAGIMIQNNLEQSGLTAGDIKFKDPWYMDFKDGSYGNEIRNRGVDEAVFRPRLSEPFNPDYNTVFQITPPDPPQSYKGVFLDQSGPPLWTPPYYSVQAISPQIISLTQTSKTHKFYFQNWSANNPSYADFEDANALQTAVVFINENAIISANLKGTQLSSNSNAFTSGSQRKFVKTDNDNLHLVYESMGKVWYERSTNNGDSWEIMNNSLPLSTDAQFPSIDFESNDIYITYQDADKRIYLYCNFYGGFQTTYLIHSIISPYAFDLSPVISVGQDRKIVVVWKAVYKFGFSGLYYWIGKESNNQIVSYALGLLPNTNENSYNPTLTTGKYSPMDPKTFYLAWQHGTSAIKYQRLVWEEPEDELFSYDYAEPSYGVSGYSSYYKPSISMYGQYPVLVWLREHTATHIADCALRIRFSSWSQFYSYGYSGGDNIEVVNINEGGNDDFILAWGGDQRYDQYLKSNSTTNIYTLNTSGDVQVSNGDGFSGMRIQSFDKYNSPHDFTLSGTDGLLKSRSTSSAIVGRQFDLINNDLTVKAGLLDIKVDDDRIPFFGEDSFLEVCSLDFNSKFETVPFTLTNLSEFTFSFNHDASIITPAALSGANNIKVKILLVDAQTNEVIGVLHERIFDSGQQLLSGVNNFLVNTSGIGEREVKLTLKVEDKLKSNSTYTITTSVIGDGGYLQKENFEEITYTGETPVTEYALIQNYPNPFNPTTTIKYQLPSNGLVTLKIYDVLGAEVISLVNEFQSKGRYEVKFDASQLSSGVYIYRIQTNDYAASKKMLLLK